MSVLIMTLFFSGKAFADSKGDEVMKKAILASYYAADDGVARVEMKLINKRGDTRERKFTMLRLDKKEGGEQKYFVYFHKPGDVRDMTYMVYKYLDKNDDRWLYIPSIHMVKRIAADDGKSSFVGSDFSYEDVSGRSHEQDEHQYLRSEKLGEVQTDVVKNVAKNPKASGFAYRVTWVDQKSGLILKDEYYNKKDKLIKIYTADKVETFDGFPTAVERTMLNVGTKHKTTVSFSKVKYNAGLKDKIFSQRSLKKPPKKWIKK
jgi:outer membrane lipoprotein-sorting protein